MDESDFKEYIGHWSVSLNPSNQNFHNKLIRSLAISNNIDVISIRPFSSKFCDYPYLEKGVRKQGNITWHYVGIHHNKILNLHVVQSQIKKIIKNVVNDGDFIFCDTINMGVVHFTKYCLKHIKKDVKFIGVVTDSPSNISGVGRSYTKYVLSNCRKYDGYLALTNELNELYNPKAKPNLIIEGLVEDRDVSAPFDTDVKYFFFGGALLPRYGIYELIKAFNEFHKDFEDYYLIIAGHHANKDQLMKAINGNTNIRFLNMIPVSEVLMYESSAVANINPRPFSEDLDRYSIPSKTIEYLVSGRPTISVKNSKLAKYFLEEIVWAKSSSSEDLKEAMVKVATADEEVKENYGKLGKEKALNYFSLKAINNRVDNELLAAFFKK